MKTAIPQEGKIATTLAVLALLISGVLYWEWTQGMQLRQELIAMRNIPLTEVPQQKVLPEFKLPPAESGFPEINARSLFAPNRRPPAPSAKGGVVAMKKGQFVLVGVLITPRIQSALLRDVVTNKTQAVALQGVVRGLTVGEVGQARVLLRQGDETEELVLNVQTGGKPSSAKSPAQPASIAPEPAKTASAPCPSASAPVVLAMPVDSATAPKPPLNSK
jgi:hypothetical protein